jgi:preprotein translocase subunit SecA
MNEVEYNYKETIIEINSIFARLSNLTGDELRDRIDIIKETIKCSDNKSKLLNTFLPEVYAIVKETARRFSQGDIVVTANNNDRRLADELDFVQIKGDQAVYVNRWEVDGVDYIWNMVHYDEQLLGGIHLHYGRAIEMATGEGKTLVATLPVFLNALSGEGVHLMTVNNYLSKRDYQITRPLYMFYGLTADCLEMYDRYDSWRKNAYLCDITFGENSSFVFDYLFDHLAIDSKACVQANHNFSIIDELDFILIDDADNPHIIGGGTRYIDEDIYQEHIGLIKELISFKGEHLFNANKLSHNAQYTDAGKSWLSHKLGIKDLFKITRTYQIQDFELLPIEDRTQVLNNIRIQNVLSQLLLALTVYEKGVDYLIIDGKVKIIDPNTGRIRENHRWEHGLHTAIEVKEMVGVQSDYDGIAVISLKHYFKLYSKISGMSGTVSTVQDELQRIYGLETVVIPTHLPIIREDHPLQIYKTRASKDEAILSNIISNYKAGRPSLVATISLKRADQIEKYLHDAGIRFNRLDARTTKDEALIVEKAGQSNTVTLSTSVAGRGTDIKLSEDALSNGGLSVIGCDLFGSIRTVLQLKGRAGRQGNPGSSIFYASLEDDILDYLSDTEKSRLIDLASQIEGDEVSTIDISDFFNLAQSKREEILRQRRIETSMKDDIVAPHRTRFYQQRNKVLFDADYASALVDEILCENQKSRLQEIYNHLHYLYEPSKVLVMRSKRNNPTRQNMHIPYSENKHPFAIYLDVDLMLTSENYFKSEFKRQNLLQVYDKFWKDFVMYMTQNLDNKEISELSDKYTKMMFTINSILMQRMTISLPTFSIDDKTTPKPSKDIEVENRKHKQITRIGSKADVLCPCGSGILYHDCHGKCSTLRTRRRR